MKALHKKWLWAVTAKNHRVNKTIAVAIRKELDAMQRANVWTAQIINLQSKRKRICPEGNRLFMVSHMIT